MRKGIQGLKEVTYVEMAAIASAAIAVVLFIRMVAGTWFLLPLIPAHIVGLFASYGMMQDKEFRFEGFLFTMIGVFLIAIIFTDAIRAAAY